MSSPPNRLPQWMTEQNKVDTVVDKKKNPVHRSILEDNLPFLEFHGSIVYSYEIGDCSFLSEDIVTSSPDGAVVGFDIEWPPSYTKGKERKVALIQLCESEKKCYLFHVSSMSKAGSEVRPGRSNSNSHSAMKLSVRHTSQDFEDKGGEGFPAGLKRLLEDKSIKKAGVGIEGDKWKLMRDFEIRLESLVELTDLANEKLKCKEVWSLNDLVKHLFHKQLLKDKTVRCGNWEQFPLTEEQKLYAATDAYAGFLIYQNLVSITDPKQVQLNIDGMLTPIKIKKELISLSVEMMDLAHSFPGNFENSTNIQRAAPMLAGISENIEALRRALHVESDCQAQLKDIADPGTACMEEEKSEAAKMLSQTECESRHLMTPIVGGQNETLRKSDEETKEKKQVDDASDKGPEKIAEREYLMSLDITEYELQMLERQAEEEMLNEANCMSEELSFVEDEDNVSCAIESDDELEMEMLKSLEGVDKYKMDFSDSRSDKAKRQNDLIADEDEDEGIEEEEEIWDSYLPVPNPKQIACLKTYFGHSSFKPVQWKVISSVLQDRRDNLVVMATGYGKSLCFQFPPVYTGGMGIVISPLISLMEDQVLQLKMSGISACLLGSAQSENVRGKIKVGHYRVVYITPEFCSGNLSWLEELDQTIGITLIAIDEAHCISEWGHDFRNSFRSLGLLKKTLPKVPVIALTATASPSIREDIINCLNLKNPQIMCTSFDRPNLYLEVGRKTGNIIGDLKQFLVQRQRDTYEFEGPTIIYCPSRKTTEQVAAELFKLNLVCGTYHAGMGIKTRRDVHHKFMRDEIQCIVATVAFGMGINKADIRTVIHYGAPKEMESYYQEIGRAGRDGLPASCYVLWTQGDMSFNRHLLSMIRNERFRLYKLKMMTKIEKYLAANSCRRKIILSHFEDKQLRKASLGIMGSEKCCDNCKARHFHFTPMCDTEDTLQDLGQQAYQLMSAICALNERFGMVVPVLFLRGSNSQRLPDKYRTHALFGSGKDWPENSWKALGRQLVMEGFLKDVSGQSKFSTICVLSKKGKDWFFKAREESERSLMLNFEQLCGRKPPVSYKQISSENLSNTALSKATLEKQRTSLHEMFAYKEASKVSGMNMLSNKSSKFQLSGEPLPVFMNAVKPTPKEEESPRERELQTMLYGKLVSARQQLANEKDIPPVLLATNKVLVDMTKIRPTTVENVIKIDGVSEAKSSMLTPLLCTIKEFCKENNLQINVLKSTESGDQPQMDFQRDGKCSTLVKSEEITYTLFQEKNMSLRNISESRSLPLSVVGTHLYQALKAGYPVNLERAGLTPEIQEMITKVIQNPPINSDLSKMEAIRALLPTNTELYLIRMTIVLLEKSSRQQPLNLQNDSETQGPHSIPGYLQPSSESSLKNKDKILWIETKGDLVTSVVQKSNSESNENIKEDVIITDSSSSAQKWHNSEEQQSGAKQATQNIQSSIKLASWNQPSLSPEEEDLFTDSQLQTIPLSSKRKLPEWFGTSKGTVPQAKTSKKSKGSGSKGLFG